jgi:hypothetical protein
VAGRPGRGQPLCASRRAAAAHTLSKPAPPFPLLPPAPPARPPARPGDKRNAIPREASADLLVPRAQLPAAAAAVSTAAAGLRDVYGSVEPELALALGPSPRGDTGGSGVVATAAGTAGLLRLLLALPHGPARFSPKMAGLVETRCGAGGGGIGVEGRRWSKESRALYLAHDPANPPALPPHPAPPTPPPARSNNLASVKPSRASPGGATDYAVVVTTRSSLPAALAAERGRVAALARLAGAEVEQPPDYAGCELPRGGAEVPVRGAWRIALSEEREAAAAHASKGESPRPLLTPARPGARPPQPQGRPTPTRRC